jgi:hypothetical protein
MNFGSPIDLLVLFIIFIKIVFIITAFGHAVLSHMTKKDNSNTGSKEKKEKDEKLVYWHERTEFIFTICMAILLIYYFNPRSMKPLNKETCLLFYLFGWILIITAKWNIFITSAKWYPEISSA